ncbi:MAG: hypothetical protein EA376_09090 [Phycisphaeraceae bacterium]|nr:MAG: hypothetical protein EA376_09090 [Phycisphaeraceae bacterium]
MLLKEAPQEFRASLRRGLNMILTSANVFLCALLGAMIISLWLVTLQVADWHFVLFMVVVPLLGLICLCRGYAGWWKLTVRERPRGLKEPSGTVKRLIRISLVLIAAPLPAMVAAWMIYLDGIWGVSTAIDAAILAVSIVFVLGGVLHFVGAGLYIVRLGARVRDRRLRVLGWWLVFPLSLLTGLLCQGFASSAFGMQAGGSVNNVMPGLTITGLIKLAPLAVYFWALIRLSRIVSSSHAEGTASSHHHEVENPSESSRAVTGEIE